MPLSTAFDPYEAALTVVCGLTAAAMHWAAITGSADKLPAGQFRANLLASGVGGLATAQGLDLVPVVSIPPLAAILVAAIVGHTLGPRALYWFGVALVKAVQKRGVDVPDLPPEDDK